MEWTLPTDVQAEAIPLILGGGDVLMAAETGSGKTGAFCLPVLQIVWETLKDFESGKATASSTSHSQPSKHWSLSLFDRGTALAVTPDGLRCQSREQKEWHGCRANKGVQGNKKFFFEATVTDEGLCRVGWSMSQATLDLGTDKNGFGFGGTGKKSNAKQFNDYSEAFGMHDVIGWYLDLLMGEFTFYPAVVLKNAEMSFNFGAQCVYCIIIIFMIVPSLFQLHKCIIQCSV
nr:ATP-dependent RNA helicase Ddx1-like isoform X2 [Megalopta genalis]